MGRMCCVLILMLAVCAPGVALAQDAAPEGLAEVEKFRDALLGSHESSFSVGEVKVTVTVIADYFAYLAAEEYIKVATHKQSEEYLKKRFKKLASKNKKYIGRPGLRLSIVHAQAAPQNFYAFEGKLPSLIAVQTRGRAKSKARFKVVRAAGPLPAQKKYTLFKPSRSALFDGNVMPVIRRVYSIFSDKAFTLDVVLKEAPSDKAERLQVGMRNLLHFSGDGIQSNQMDFEHGAKGAVARGAGVSFDLPLTRPELPKVLVKLLPS